VVAAALCARASHNTFATDDLFPGGSGNKYGAGESCEVGRRARSLEKR